MEQDKSSDIEQPKTTFTTGALSCLISFTWTLWSCEELTISDKIKMKIYVSSEKSNQQPGKHSLSKLATSIIGPRFKQFSSCGLSSLTIMAYE